jgi:hypothetical protein
VGNKTKIFLTLTSNNSGKIAKKRWDIQLNFIRKKQLSSFEDSCFCFIDLSTPWGSVFSQTEVYRTVIKEFSNTLLTNISLYIF